MYDIFYLRSGSAHAHVTGIAASYSEQANWTSEVLHVAY